MHQHDSFQSCAIKSENYKSTYKSSCTHSYPLTQDKEERPGIWNKLPHISAYGFGALSLNIHYKNREETTYTSVVYLYTV